MFLYPLFLLKKKTCKTFKITRKKLDLGRWNEFPVMAEAVGGEGRFKD